VIGLVGVAMLLSIALGAWVWSRQPKRIPGMIFFRGGTFTAGTDRRLVEIAPFYIDETEVSNADFSAYCQSTGCTAPAGAADLPVVGITVAQARAYAAWNGKRLPTALEWERAAQGKDDGSRFPWGNAEDPSLANVRDNPSLARHELMPVRSFAAYPAYQMAGNAWEIVEGTVTPSAGAVAMFSTLVTPPPTAEEKWIEIHGGSFNTPLASAVNFMGAPIPERYSSSDIGFRCARNP